MRMPLPPYFGNPHGIHMFYTLVFLHLIFSGDGVTLYTQHFLIHLNDPIVPCSMIVPKLM